MHANEQAQTLDGKQTPRTATPQSSRASTPMGLLALQTGAGNAAVVQMLRQAGHSWAQPEQHQHGAGCGHQQTEPAAQPAVQRSTVRDVLRTTGRPLDGATRTDMESRLGADFSDVRIHNDSAAKASAAEVGARAYTSGNHVVLGDGGTDKHTLAHELTHVIQQRQGPVAGTDNGTGLKVSDPSDRFEREAEANAARAMSGTVQRAEAPHIQSTKHSLSQATVQRFSMERTPELGNVRLTQNGLYLLTDEPDTDAFWVRRGAPVPRYCRPTGQEGEIQGSYYVEYEPTELFLADCGHTAEEIMHEKRLKQYQDASRFANPNGRVFGMSEEDNIAGAEDFRDALVGLHGQYNPGDQMPVTGEAFAIIETAENADGTPGNVSGWPYHVAAVVATDGNDQITIEQTAGSSNAKPRKGYPGIVDIYQAGTNRNGEAIGASFHGRFTGAEQFSRDAITVILAPLPGNLESETGVRRPGK
ncbi:DUF4157 domain-containing protein [Streptomyces violascens]|uniref:eCIS core domain-containing protein n=1 Tax=Streptomyces violascens TaxID=67381 RepID=UPI00365037E8